MVGNPEPGQFFRRQCPSRITLQMGVSALPHEMMLQSLELWGTLIIPLVPKELTAKSSPSLVSVTVPVSVQTHSALPSDRAFQPGVDLSLVFKGWGPFPAVRGVRNQTGAWDRAGASRNPILSDGSTAAEKLTEYTPGHSFAYEVTGFTNIVLRRLAYGVRGEWTFTRGGSGTVIRWTYEFEPLRRRYWLVRHVLAPLWRHYMQAGVEAAARAAEDR